MLRGKGKYLLTGLYENLKYKSLKVLKFKLKIKYISVVFKQYKVTKIRKRNNLKNHTEKMSICVNVHISKIMCTSIKVFIYLFTWHTIKTNCIKLWTIDPDIFIFFREEPGFSFSTTFCEWFFKKNVFHVAFC